MKRYRFTLESVLRARRAQEDLARQQLAQANRALRRAQATLADVTAAYDRRPVDRGQIDLAGLHRQRLDGELAAAEVDRRRGQLADAAVEAATHYARWTEAARLVAALERLDERRRAEWRLEAQRQEAAAVDDVVTSRFIADEQRARRLDPSRPVAR